MHSHCCFSLIGRDNVLFPWPPWSTETSYPFLQCWSLTCKIVGLDRSLGQPTICDCEITHDSWEATLSRCWYYCPSRYIVYYAVYFTIRYHMPVLLVVLSAHLFLVHARVYTCITECYEQQHADFIIEAVKNTHPYHSRLQSGGMLKFHNGLLCTCKIFLGHMHVIYHCTKTIVICRRHHSKRTNGS